MRLQELQLDEFLLVDGSTEAIFNTRILPQLSILELSACDDDTEGGAHLVQMSKLRYTSQQRN